MNDYLVLLHDDAEAEIPSALWPGYLGKLRDLGVFDGGSAIGAGVVVRTDGVAVGTTTHLGGYLRVRAESLTAVRALLEGNPVYESGGSVEIRVLPKS